MNERIKQLAEEAFAVCGKHSNNYNGPAFSAKFAELIVRECVTVMYDDAIKRKVPPDINQTPTHYAVAVLEHFGVEE
jgi:hypothetical protein